MKYISRFCGSSWYLVTVLVTGAVSVYFHLEVVAALIFGLLVTLCLLSRADISYSFFPFIIAITFFMDCEERAIAGEFNYVLMLSPLLIPLVLYNIIVFRKKMKTGIVLRGYIAVGAALLAGGIGSISKAEYFAPGTLYYTVGLGFGMAGAYYVMKLLWCDSEKYKLREKFSLMIYLSGLAMAALVFWKAYLNFDTVRSDFKVGSLIGLAMQRMTNVPAMMIMIALPFAFLYTRKNYLNIVSVIIMYIALLVHGSRAGIFIGLIIVAMCAIWVIIADKKHRYLNIAAFALGGLAAIFCANHFYQYLIALNYENGFFTDSPRLNLIRRAAADFYSRPIFGRGIGYSGNTDLYKPPGSFLMHWYHCEPMQILASLGLFGAAAYIFRFIDRLRLLLGNMDMYTAAFSLSYLGILIHSLVDIGEFAPIPVGILMLFMFILIENREEACGRIKHGI